MADYFEHWLEIGRRGDAAKLPRIFYVNWFRKDADGRFLWPGFGENSRVLEWVFRRCAGEADAHETPIGLVPAPGDLDTGGLDIAAEDLEEVLTVDPDALREQLPQLKEHLAQFGDDLPDELQAQLEALEQRLERLTSRRPAGGRARAYAVALVRDGDAGLPREHRAELHELAVEGRVEALAERELDRPGRRLGRGLRLAHVREPRARGVGVDQARGRARR